MNNSFWTGGSSAYYKGIKSQYREQIRQLQTQLQDCTDDLKRQAIKREIAAAKAELKAKLGKTGKLIF